MIELKKGNQKVDLNPGARIRLSLISPFFAGDIGYNSQSLSFTLPYTPNNRDILGDPAIIQKAAAPYEIELDVWLFGMFWRAGKLRITLSGPATTYRGVLLLEVSPFIAAIKGKKLADYELGGKRVITNAGFVGQARADDMTNHATQTLSLDVDSSDYVFAMITNRMFEVPREGVDLTNTGRGKWINQYVPSQPQIGGGSTPVELVVNNYWRDAPAPGGEVLNRFSICPFVYLGYLLREIITAEGYLIDETDDFWSDDELKTLFIYNNYLLDEGINESFGAVNAWKTYINLKNHVPDIEVSNFLLGFINSFGFGIFEKGGKVGFSARKNADEDLDQLDFRERVILYTTAHNEPKGCKIERERDGSNLNQSSPLLLEEFREEITGEVNTVADLPALTIAELDQIYYVIESNELWKFSAIIDPLVIGVPSMEWQFYSFYNFPITLGAGKKPLNIGAGTGEPLPEEFYTYMTAEFQIEPRSEFWEEENDSYGLYFAFYRGLISRDGGELYSESGVTDEFQRFNYSLLLHGERGLYKTWWESWLNRLSDTRILTVVLNLAPADILNFDFRKKVRIRTSEEELVGYISKLDFEITAQRIVSVKAEFRPIDID